MGFLERLDQLDRRVGFSGDSTRPTAAGWILGALLVAAGVGVVVTAVVTEGAGGAVRVIAPVALGLGLARWAGARGGRQGLVRVGGAVLVAALLLSLPAALLGFWQGSVLVLIIGGIPLIVLSLTERGSDA